VDIGGIEGMVHISEISHLRIKHPSEILKSGQSINVKVVKVEADKEGHPKISLSIKSLEPDSWEKGLGFEEGEIIRGNVSKLTDFSAFVEVASGVDGLVHISEISYEHVPHPKVKWVGEGIDYRASWIHSYEKNECGKVSGWFEE
jgi:small subunit ribosomal protein S1